MGINYYEDGAGNIVEYDDGVSYDENAAEEVQRDIEDSYTDTDPEQVMRDLRESQQQTELVGDPFATGQGSLTGGSGSLASTDPNTDPNTDPSLLKRASQLLGIPEDRITRGMLGALAGGLGGYLLSREPSTVQSRGIKSLPYTPNIATPTRAVGTGGRGSVRHFNRPSDPVQTPMGYSPAVYGPTGTQYVSSDTARAAGVNNFTLNRPTGVAPPPDTTGNANLVNQAYLSLFGRSAEPAGLSFFTQGLDSGQINQENLLASIRQGAQGTDRDLLARRGFAAGGRTPSGLGYLRSAEDGMADRIPATIDGRQPAKLSGGEFVIPADVVSHLGNGNSDAGAKQLHDFMARIRKARTGNQAQGKRIDPAKFFPKGRG